MRLSIIVAMDDNQLIGKDNALPWHLPADLGYFKETTTGKTVLMGRKTYESIGFPLPNRRNVIVSRNADFTAKGCEVVSSITAALELAKHDDEVMIMGGASFYEQMLPSVDRLYITQIEGSYEGDAHFPTFDRSDFSESFRESHQPDDKNPHTYYFTILDRK
ncbi:Dihydrofolate reductase (EC 1.5.1.3) [uncultured Gammaproteobacteria bacterium]|uniref:type 3 dihydrofolate reductase n=1 Tax=Bathymodiolus heckerae thiotrophic gill symbiont TaxID=1052212 RepID=UPI0010B36B70|nr:type 3 dihydrofolate reductase [Bathymodiolus heckerae thiotrophic gill symbiont]CAC9594979.1 Dihydrofolate reductase (EC 1.5.1.3) [uncultured Gammaproteobacteria bacterium]CAC9960271.1 Dihydrofolate reductase (EC 1.5.1.3) [uncultured Gammaproteobacteria bacterium]CAC9965186.1 Dihydrofolate reductase (EC 1.5.1.3) [uncultured Gammaproteobacteria bacterium]SHN90536.1 Dihydrofolate reductase [Bathymodiolus heckerae thiotrophic gill symbiont]